ncbi:MAG: hypothetical protein GY778_07290, partial [bacterium]|nr:hypothetical protein [bacterium]
HQSVAVMMNTSLELLEEDKKRERFGELGIFPEDADIPIGIVERLWRQTGGLDEIDSEDLLVECLDLSLLLGLDLERRSLRFHDTVRHFLQDQAGAAGLAAQHKRLLGALEDLGGADTGDPADRRYYYQYLPEHLAAAGERAALDDLLLDPNWLRDKLATLGSPLALVGDYDRHGATEAQNLIGRTLRLTTGICTRDPRQLIPQLHGRLMAVKPVMETGFVGRLEQALPRPSLITTRPSLTPPGVEIARLEDHAEGTWALAVLPDGCLASGSSDGAVRMWNVVSGTEVARLEAHGGFVMALAVLPDGRLASGSEDGTIRLWNSTSGAETACLEGHHITVDALAMLPDGRLASGYGDGTIRLWDPVTEVETARLEGHVGRIEALVLLADGRL